MTKIDDEMHHFREKWETGIYTKLVGISQTRRATCVNQIKGEKSSKRKV